MLNVFKDLKKASNKIYSDWSKCNFDCEKFIEIAHSKTQDLSLLEFGELSNLIELLKEPEVAALQEPSTFSDLYLSLIHI